MKFSSIFIIISLMLFFMGFANAYAADEVNIQAQQLDVDNDTGEAIFTGDVVVTKEDLVLTADKVIVLYTTEEDTKEEVQTIHAEGHVKMVANGRTVTADKALYEPHEEKVTLLENVSVSEDGEGNILFGTKMLYDVANDRMTLSGGQSTGGRVRGTFQSNQEAQPQNPQIQEPTITAVPALPEEASPEGTE